MSDASTQNLKVSREGIVLIKSFEGFRPRAIRREEGGWVIGYGHTLSAREGATVSEGDAELLLRYDLLPVEKTLNETVPPGLNQHQFDALVSFAFSVGLDRFVGSDVSQRLTAGAPDEAADAMMGWPEPVLPQTALRRRVAERALFTADPASPVALSDLLAAPLPPPPMVTEVEPEVATEPTIEASEPQPDPRGAAVAALLGEQPATFEDGQATVVPIFGTPVDEAAEHPVSAIDPAVEGDPAPLLDPDAPAAEIWTDAPADAGPVSDAPPAEEPGSAPAPDAFALATARYAPYGATMVGPLPYLQPAAPRLVQPEPQNEPETSVAEDVTFAPEPVDAPADAQPLADVPDTATEDQSAVGPALDDAVETPAVPEPVVDREIVVAALAPLVLTPDDDAPEPAVSRALWTPEQRAEPVAAPEAGLFGEDLSLTQGGGPILRHENDPEPPVRFDWSETGAFIIMGAVGLTAFGASMAAFRLASEQSNGGSETTMIAWVLAVIGAACVGVSSFNLYRRWGLPGGD